MRSNRRKPGNKTKIPKPRWDAVLNELWVATQLVKAFRRPAQNMIALLAAFQEQDWDTRIDDPLPPRHGVDSKQRLHDAIKRLNRCQRPQVIRFIGDGTGQGIRWSFISPGSAPDRP